MAVGDPMNAEGLGLSFLIAFEVPNLFSGLLPSLFTISTFTNSDADKAEHAKKWIRKGELQAGVVSLGLGLGGTIVTKTPWPILLTLLMIGWLVWQYETALRRGTEGDGPGLDMAAGYNPKPI
ncbi:hypothetical protein AB0451_39395 [Streptomyces sp. NPDC052000]|uniref:hypothetical protein n=1 Tax=Streptomyces sp. NPDC052000 TaxID=3155676 RepID=UPI00344CB585